MLNICASDRLKGENLEASEYVTQKDTHRSLRMFGVPILENCNDLLQRLEIDSPCVGLKFDLPKQSTNEPLSGFFSDWGHVYAGGAQFCRP
jgi:hypothetical protein